jgi:hypothetical protein
MYIKLMILNLKIFKQPLFYEKIVLTHCWEDRNKIAKIDWEVYRVCQPAMTGSSHTYIVHEREKESK